MFRQRDVSFELRTFRKCHVNPQLYVNRICSLDLWHDSIGPDLVNSRPFALGILNAFAKFRIGRIFAVRLWPSMFGIVSAYPGSCGLRIFFALAISCTF